MKPVHLHGPVSMSLLSLPHDVIAHRLIPFLPTLERIQMNLALPKSYKAIGRITKGKILQFELHLLSVLETKRCRTIVNSTGPRRQTLILQWLRDFKSYAPIIQYNNAVRGVFVDRVEWFAGKNELHVKSEAFLIEVTLLRDQIVGWLSKEYSPRKDLLIYKNGNLPAF